MSNSFVLQVGGVVSADIAVPDHERELQFYSRVLSTGEDPLWHEDLMNNQGMPIIGLGEKSDAFASLPLQWMPHIQVADVATSVERALGLGGRELMHGKDENGKSLWAGLLDPRGVAFGIIPVVSPEAMPAAENIAGHTGHIAWLDLTVSNASETCDFYKQVVGWSVQDVQMEDAGERYVDFNMLSADGTPAAGVCHARGENQDVPAVWMIYLPVGDLAESLRRVPEEGGTVIKASRGSDGSYTTAVIQDPVGVYIALASV